MLKVRFRRWYCRGERRFPADFADDRRVEIRVDQRDQENLPQIPQIFAEKNMCESARSLGGRNHPEDLADDCRERIIED